MYLSCMLSKQVIVPHHVMWITPALRPEENLLEQAMSV